jgi:hypothetical protein
MSAVWLAFTIGIGLGVPLGGFVMLMLLTRKRD